MGYIQQTLTEGEEIVASRKLHWIIYLPAALLLLIGFGFLAAPKKPDQESANVVFAIIAIVGFVKLILAVIRRSTTELAVTNLRVVAKRGLIRRDVIEIDLSKLEGFDLKQSVIGRLLGYGTVLFRGTGQGASPMKDVDDPVEFARAGRDMLRIYRDWERQQHGAANYR